MEQLTEFVSKSFNPDRPLSSAVSGFPHLLASTKGVPGGPRSLHSVVDRLSAPHLFPMALAHSHSMGLSLAGAAPLLLAPPPRPTSGGTSSPSSVLTDKEDRTRDDNDSNDRHGEWYFLSILNLLLCLLNYESLILKDDAK
ncbi:uncharacterized protein CDAR_396381 [Caerostris darwini]|uniref:Uncharacterized protein n=1 Tax=Caerostris darwini TaxID=1538125 RepID=A0AAV4URN7_9ARAC|nr:uncharacterized protein CDAR_396381 [Caerostris darwini]